MNLDLNVLADQAFDRYAIELSRRPLSALGQLDLFPWRSPVVELWLATWLAVERECCAVGTIAQSGPLHCSAGGMNARG